MIEINAHVLCSMLCLAALFGVLIGRLTEMWTSRHKQAELGKKLDEMNCRLAALQQPTDPQQKH